jgi:hypothetical protein
MPKKALKASDVALAAGETARKRADIRQVNRYAELEDEKAQLEDQLKVCKAKLAELVDPVLAYFQAQGLESMATPTRTLYLRRELWAAKVEDGADPATLVEALEAAGMGEYAPEKINWQGLSAFLRERVDVAGMDPDEAVPTALRPYFKVSEVYKIGSRRR